MLTAHENQSNDLVSDVQQQVEMTNPKLSQNETSESSQNTSTSLVETNKSNSTTFPASLDEKDYQEVLIVSGKIPNEVSIEGNSEKDAKMTNNEFQKDDQGKQCCSDNIKSDTTSKHTTVTEEKDEAETPISEKISNEVNEVSMERNSEKDTKMTNNEFHEDDQGKQCCSNNIKPFTTSKHITVAEKKDEAETPVSENIPNEVSMEGNSEKDAKMTNNEFQKDDQGKQCCSNNIKSDTTSKHTTKTEEKDEAETPISEKIPNEVNEVSMEREFHEGDQGKQCCSNNIKSDTTSKHTTITEGKDEAETPISEKISNEANEVSMERNSEKDTKMTNNEFHEDDQGKQCCSNNIKSDTTSKHTTVAEEAETPISETPVSETPVSETPSNETPKTQINAVSLTMPAKKKKKKKKKKKIAEGADPDLDFHEPGPKEEDENKLYDPSRPITHRIEAAIQKYKKNRKFSSTRNQVFSSYLRFGGVSTGQRAFQGQDGIDNADADADEITTRRATDFIELDEEEVEVDFTYIAEVYLSSYLIDKSGYVQIDQFREGPQVVMSFLNYLIQHEVCPEYLDDMTKALEIAKRAKSELPNCKYLAQLAPGLFNKACSLLYGGELHSLFDDPWNGEENVAKLIGISPAESEKIAISVFGDIALELIPKKSLISFEVIILEIEPIQESNTPEADNNTESTEDSKTDNTEKKEISLRKMTVRSLENEKEEPFVIHLSSDVANYPMPGMLVTADFYQLSNNWWYWDRVTNVYPSYYLAAEDSDYDD
ncbi:hypothetical protein Glove_144g12 [Diversispora epigaea]|uniref:Argonaute siRNA chaperone complex subunit Arb1-domain-containing protein n=1 Tax=Diversispora epigaea TaxID=1348612 RepID=A0A397IU86_9GLOM|nr:hypothetical protein Glove_144g12 [Diversispora epigaea]